MKNRLVLLLSVALCQTAFTQLPYKSRAYSANKIFHVQTPIPNRYIVVLNATVGSPAPAPVAASSLDAAEDTAGASSENEVSGAEHASAADPAPEVAAPSPDPGVVAVADDLVNTYGGQYTKIWSAALEGFLLEATESVAEAMSADSRVRFIEEDGVVAQEFPAGTPPAIPIMLTIDPVTGLCSSCPISWGLDRIDQRFLPLNSAYLHQNTGAGVNVYVIDTGITPTHWEFDGRAVVGYDARGGDGVDCNGHGTHVAGTIGGRTYGVASGVSLFGVRVLDCEGAGAWSDVIEGVNWVTWHHHQPAYHNSTAVANVSLGGGGASYSVDLAVRFSILTGVIYTVAAGNGNIDARQFSPARVAEAITVGATDSSDLRPDFSNYGPALDLFAPGVEITAAWIGNDLMVATASGTSMAAPHAAGVVALYLQNHRQATPAAVATLIRENATGGVLANTGQESPNRLLYMNY